jgi:hypothetical protein
MIGFSKPRNSESEMEKPKRKMIDNEEELRKQLERCTINLSHCKR